MEPHTVIPPLTLMPRSLTEHFSNGPISRRLLLKQLQINVYMHDVHMCILKMCTDYFHISQVFGLKCRERRIQSNITQYYLCF